MILEKEGTTAIPDLLVKVSKFGLRRMLSSKLINDSIISLKLSASNNHILMKTANLRKDQKRILKEVLEVCVSNGGYENIKCSVN